MSKKKAKSPNKAEWASDYFTAALDNLERLQNVLELSAQGISSITGVPALVEALGKSSEQVEEAQRRARLAQAEVDRQYATLNGFGVMALWSWLETFVIDFVVLWINRRPSSLKALKAPKVRIDLAEYARMRGIERARFIADAIDRELGGALRNGMGRFDGLLAAIDLHVPLDEESRRDILELQQIRNCLSHRFGVVDPRLATTCPWLNLRVGDSLVVTRRDFGRYTAASSRFLLLLLYEIGDVLGVAYRSAGEDASRRRKSSSPTVPARDELRAKPSAAAKPEQK